MDVQCAFQVIVKKLVIPPAAPNCLDPQCPHDRVLVADHIKLYVNSQVLSMWSGYFDKLFNSEFAESTKKEIEISGVSPGDLCLLIEQMVPKPADITYVVVNSLLTMADRFDVPVVTMRCVDFVKENPDDYYTIEIMRWDDEYKLLELQETAYKLLLELPSLHEYIENSRVTFDILPQSTKQLILYAYHLDASKK